MPTDDYAIPAGAARTSDSRGTLGRVTLRPLYATLLLAASLSACAGNSDSSDAVAFCVEGRNNQSLIVDPPLGTQAEVDAAIEFYRLMGDLAPVDIADQWDDLVALMEMTNEMSPGDADSEQQVAQHAYAADRSAYDVMVWFRDYCDVRLPITTIVPHGPIDIDSDDGSSVPPTTSG